jgi:iron complex transport system substrate-binding protein
MFVHIKRSNILFFTLAGVMLFLAACSVPPLPPPAGLTVIAEPAASPQATSAPTTAPATIAPTSAPPTASATIAPTSAPTAAPTQAASMTLTDSAGRSVTLGNVPARIISLAPSNTEIVCALGACDKLIGIDQFSDFPAQVKSLPKVSDGFNPNYEQIVAAKPDLVLIAAISSPDVVKKFDEIKLPALVIGDVNSSFASVKKDIQLVGKALGADTQATEVIAGMDKKLADLQTKLAQAKTKPRVFWELDATDPAKPFTPGPGTFVNEIIALAGGENIAGKATSPYVQINAEQVIQSNPEVIILSDAAYGVPPESVAKRPGWDVITAVKENKVFAIDDNLVSRPGPRVIDGLEAAAKLIHPELFEAPASQTTFTDPFAYCGSVGNIDTPGANYTGDRVPQSVIDGLLKALGNPSTPTDTFIQGTFWRCMGGKVYACNVGANIPCESKADTNKTPTQAERDYCQQHPTADNIPAFVTGHATVYEWACKSGTPEIVKQLLQVDAQGYPKDFWYEISK